MSLMVGAEHLGTPEAEWVASRCLDELRPLSAITSKRAIIVAPHPDDEVLGAGGLIQRLMSQGLLVEVIAVTDGESSHPGSRSGIARRLPSVRAEETRQALARLGLVGPQVTRLGIGDGCVSHHEQELVGVLMDRLRPGDLCVSPWEFDGHPDHDACGRASLRSACMTGASALGCLVWAWHWARPDSDDLPWDKCRRVELTRREAARKRWATASFRSQIRPIGPGENDRAVLLPSMHRRYWRPFEVFVHDGSLGD